MGEIGIIFKTEFIVKLGRRAGIHVFSKQN